MKIETELSKFVISSDSTIREAFRKKDRLQLDFVLVEKNMNIIGVVTDGDFLRAHNSLVDFDSPVESLANIDFISVTTSCSPEKIRSIFDKKKIMQIPIIENGILKGIYNKKDFQFKSEKMIISGNKNLEKLILASKILHNVTENKKKILFFSRGSKFMILWETLLALALSKMGVEPIFIVCNDLSICNFSSVQRPDMNCKNCFKNADIPKQFGFNVINLKDLIEEEKIDLDLPDTLNELKEFEYESEAFGKKVKASVKRYFLNSNLSNIGEKDLILVYKRFISSSLLTYISLKRFAMKFSVEKALLFNGVYSQMYSAFRAFRALHLPTITYESANNPRGEYWFIQKDRPVLGFDFSKEWKSWNKIAVPEKYLPLIYKKKEFDKKLDIDSPFELSSAVLLLTSVNWDLASIDLNSPFNSMEEWIMETIEYFRKSGKNLIIRIHPKDSDKYENDFAPSIYEYIIKHYKKLPDNIWIITPSEKIDSYSLVNKCKKVVLWATTMGMEIAAMGRKPTVLTDIYYSSKGFTKNIKIKEDYFKGLTEEDEKLSRHEQETAQRYYFFFLVRIRIPVQFFTTNIEIDIASFTVEGVSPHYSSYTSEKNKQVKFICDRILNNKDFVLSNDQLLQYSSK